MAEPFLSEIRIMSFVFAPKGWAACNGQLMPINQNQALFALLGTTFGGDGRVTFGLPNLQGRTPLHVGDGLEQDGRHVLARYGGLQAQPEPTRGIRCRRGAHSARAPATTAVSRTGPAGARRAASAV